MAWTEQDKRFLIDNNNKITVDEISEIMGKSKICIYQMRYRLGLSKYKWCEEDIRKLKEMYRYNSAKDIASKLNRTEEEVKVQIKRLGLNEDIWTYTTVEVANLLGVARYTIKYFQDKGYLKYKVIGNNGKGKRVSTTLDIKEFMESYKDNWCPVKGYKALELFKEKPLWLKEKIERDSKVGGYKSNSHWTNEEDKKLAELYDKNLGYSLEDISNILGRSVTSIRQRASILFLNR